MNKITLTYCPSNIEKNRICGHTFEVMDYFLLLYDLNYSVNILIQEKINKQVIFDAWEDKYDLPKDYKKFINFKPNTKIILADTLIITSGLNENYLNKVKVISKKLILFRCNPSINYSNIIDNKKVFLLNDMRVYKDNIGDHYIKKIYFKRFKKLNKIDKKNNKTLIYINSNLRKLETIKEDKNMLYVSGTDHNFGSFVLQAPIKKLFDKFDTFLYTRTTRQFDCSPRLITECYYYNKKIEFDFNFKEYCGPDYGDTGLYWRMYDINTDFDKVFLTEEDEVLNYI
jgi:hypothetical protein